MKLLPFVALVLFGQLTYIHAMDGDATYYNIEAGYTACGERFINSDFIAATAFSYWTTSNPNVDPMCRRSARVTDPATGNSVTVRIKDKCAGCQVGDIDLTPAAFQRLRPLSVGRFRVQWNFV